MGLVSTSAASGEEVTSGCSAGSAHRGQLSGRRLSPRRGHRSVPQGGWVQSSALSAVWSPRGSFPSNSILRAPLTAPGHLPLPPACPPPRFLLRVPPPPQELRKKMQKTLLETCFKICYHLCDRKCPRQMHPGRCSRRLFPGLRGPVRTGLVSAVKTCREAQVLVFVKHQLCPGPQAEYHRAF